MLEANLINLFFLCIMWLLLQVIWEEKKQREFQPNFKKVLEKMAIIHNKNIEWFFLGHFIFTFLGF